MSASLLLGTQWGDEGKAKVIDCLSADVDIVVRYQGGSNAGHTVDVDGEKFVFHLIPSGILYPNILCILGGGMVINPEEFLTEVRVLESRGIKVKERIYIYDNAHLLQPYHQEIDILRETEWLDSESKIGTTKKGIGMCYSDKVQRQGIRIADLYEPTFFTDRLPVIIEIQSRILSQLYGKLKLNLETEVKRLKKIGEQLKPYVLEGAYYLNTLLSEGKKVILEGAQGTMLDIDFGTYPHVTSSNPTTGGAFLGTGMAYHYLKNVIGIAKVYTTRVGDGPFPTEIFGSEGEKIGEIGAEYGSTTGRKRRCGWFDVEVVKHAIRINGMSTLVLTKLDVFDTFDEIQIGISYKRYGKRLTSMPTTGYENIEVEYITLPGWNQDTSRCTDYETLPQNAKNLIENIEKYCNISVSIVSVGPERSSTLHRQSDILFQKNTL